MVMLVVIVLDLKYKLYLCNVRCNKPLEALSMLQSIPAKQRTARINMALGKLYLENGMERAAVTSFKEVLRVNLDISVARSSNKSLHNGWY